MAQVIKTAYVPRSGIPARAAWFHTVRRWRRRRPAGAVRATGLYVRHRRAIDRWSTAIGTVRPTRPVGSIWPARPVGSVWSIGTIRPVRPIWPVRTTGPARPVWPVGAIGPVRAPWPVWPPWPVGSAVTVAPMMVAPRAVAVIVRVDACTERRGTKEERQRGCEPGHDCGCFLLLAAHPVGLPAQHCACITPCRSRLCSRLTRRTGNRSPEPGALSKRGHRIDNPRETFAGAADRVPGPEIAVHQTRFLEPGGAPARGDDPVTIGLTV